MYLSQAAPAPITQIPPPFTSKKTSWFQTAASSVQKHPAAYLGGATALSALGAGLAWKKHPGVRWALLGTALLTGSAAFLTYYVPSYY